MDTPQETWQGQLMGVLTQILENVGQGEAAIEKQRLMDGGVPLIPSGGHVPSSPQGKRALLLRPSTVGVLQLWGFSTRCFQSLTSNLMSNHLR